MSKCIIIIYARVSTATQNHSGQLQELRDYCRGRGWMSQEDRGVEEITDVISSTKQSREGLDRLMQQVRKGRVEVVVAYKLDRLARSLGHLAQLIGELQAHRTALICPSQGIDTTESNPVAHLQINILAAVAQFERDLIVERVRAGLRAARERGVRLGRPSTLARHLPAVIELRREGLGPAAISQKLGIPLSSAGELMREAQAIMTSNVKS